MGVEKVLGGKESFFVSSSGRTHIESQLTINTGSIPSGYALNVKGNAYIEGNQYVTGTITGGHYNNEYLSSSTVYASGSSTFGDTPDDVHSYTGSFQAIISASNNDLRH